MGWRADNARLARVALGMRALTTANASLAAELERLLGLYDKTGDWYQLVVWLRKVVEQEKSA